MSPFFMALFVLLFILLANFLLKSIDKFLGKGLDLFLLSEFVFLNMAWILALAVPMAVLVATLMAFGRLSSDNEITAMRANGSGFFNLLIPSLSFGLIVTILMIIFNNWVLPEMNHKARMLSSDLSRKRPDLEFEAGYFIDALPNNSILLGGREDSVFTDIVIYNQTPDAAHRTITAKSGTIETLEDGVVMHLQDGVIHELSGQNEEYRQIYFVKYQVLIPIENMRLKRRDSSIRGDREMTTAMIQDKITDFRGKIESVKDRMGGRINKELGEDITFQPEQTIINQEIEKFEKLMVASLAESNPKQLKPFKRRMKNLRQGVKSDLSLIQTYKKTIQKYKVEMHKKFSIPVACIIFILIGAPLGIMTQKGNFSVSIALSLGFFIIYWMFLIGGEEFADRGLFSPALSMWMPNIVLGFIGLFLCYRTSREQHFLRFELFNLFKREENST